MAIDVDWIRQQFPDLRGLQPLARGGQKVVFAANHNADGDIVLKLLLRETGNDRLAREVLAGELVDCERVPRIIETGLLDTPIGECIWVREQRIHGVTLRTRLASGPLPFDEALRLGLQLLATLEVAERKRIVHRDIKPENVMVDGQGDYWLLDFGLARHLDLESLTATHLQFGVGTLGYAAPEQFRNLKRQIDCRADLFGLGVLLYECAVGHNPFIVGARDQLEVLRRVEQMPLPRLNHAKDAAYQFADFLNALTQKHRTQRPRSTREAYQWLEDVQRMVSSPSSPAGEERE